MKQHKTNNAMDQMVQIVAIQREICGRIERAADSSGHGWMGEKK